MSYVIEISGLISYTDNTNRSFLAVGDHVGNLKVNDESVLKDAIPTIRTMLSAVDSTYSIPTFEVPDSKIKDVIVEINCSYTIDSENYQISIISSSLTGLLIEGNGSWAQFALNYASSFEILIRTICPGSFINSETMIRPLYFRIKNNSNYQQGITFRVYKKHQNGGAGLLIFEQFVGASSELEAFVYDFKTGGVCDRTFYCSAVRSIDPAPTVNEINTEISVMGIASADIVVSGGVSVPFTMSLTNIV